MFGGNDTSKSGVGGNGARFRWKSHCKAAPAKLPKRHIDATINS
jgi:hypothetical protein